MQLNKYLYIAILNYSKVHTNSGFRLHRSEKVIFRSLSKARSNTDNGKFLS